MLHVMSTRTPRSMLQGPEFQGPNFQLRDGAVCIQAGSFEAQSPKSGYFCHMSPKPEGWVYVIPEQGRQND